MCVRSGSGIGIYFQFPDLASRGTVDSLINFKRGRVREGRRKGDERNSVERRSLKGEGEDEERR